MLGQPAVRFVNQPFVKEPLICSCFVACYQQHGLALRVKGKCYASYLFAMAKAQLFYVAVLATFQGIHCWPA
jgi:hypothetical protein